jgi:hypothetical protein
LVRPARAAHRLATATVAALLAAGPSKDRGE